MSRTTTYSTNKLQGVRVVGGKSGSKRIGKVRRFVFHPTSKRCVGFIVKRPDLALMFHRSDLFIPVDGFEIEDGRVAIFHGEKDMEGKRAIARLGLDWDACTMWEGMPILTESGEELGTVGDIVFAHGTGKVISITANQGATAKTLLGQKVIPAKLIRGFKLGRGIELAMEGEETSAESDPIRGAILVSDQVLQTDNEGGLAEKAGQKTAVAKHKTKQVVDAAKPKVDEMAKKTGEAINKGAYTVGKQLKASKGMFAEFKKEYDKAVKDE